MISDVAKHTMPPSDPADSRGLIPDTPINEGKTLFAASVTLRVAEARVEDIGRATARLSPADMVRIGARPGDVLQITGRMVAVARAEPAGDRRAGHRADRRHGPRATAAAGSRSRCRSRASSTAPPSACGWRVSAARSVTPPSRRSGSSKIWTASPVITGCVVRVPTFAKAVNFQVVRTIPAGPVVIDKRTDRPGRRGRRSRRRRRRASRTRTSAASSASWSASARSSSCRSSTRASSSASASCRRRACCCTARPGPARPCWRARWPPRAGVHFIHLNGPEIMRKFYGESEAQAPRGVRGSGPARAGDHLHRRDRRRGAQARRGRRRGGKARRRAAARADGRLRRRAAR